MKVKRIMATIATGDVAKAKRFYGDILGLDVLMDHGWLVTYGSDAKMSVQVSVATEGGSGTPVPDPSIEGIVWSNGYLDFGLCMIVQEGMAATFRSPSDLNGKRVAIYDLSLIHI